MVYLFLSTSYKKSMEKYFNNSNEAIADIKDGSTIMVQSFVGSAGVAQTLIKKLAEKNNKNLTVIMCANPAFPGGNVIHKDFKPFYAPRDLIKEGMLKKAIIAWGKNATSMFPGETKGPWDGIEDKIEYEFMPMGVMAHRIRAAGNGIGAFFSPVGAGTWYANGKESKTIDGKEYVLEYPLKADFGFVKASKADKYGNLVYKLGERMFSPLIAKACKTVIAEVDEIVEPGEIPPDHVMTPGIYVNRIVLSTVNSKEDE
jgi:3-oxoadipate CoA-transferase alpha subunit